MFQFLFMIAGLLSGLALAQLTSKKSRRPMPPGARPTSPADKARDPGDEDDGAWSR